MKQLAWSYVKGKVKDWLETRALVLPSAKVQEAAKAAKITPEQVRIVEGLLREHVMSEVEKFKP